MVSKGHSVEPTMGNPTEQGLRKGRGYSSSCHSCYRSRHSGLCSVQHSPCSLGKAARRPSFPLRAMSAAYHRRNLCSDLCLLLPETLRCCFFQGEYFTPQSQLPLKAILVGTHSPALPGASVDPFLGRGRQETVLLGEQAWLACGVLCTKPAWRR